MALVKRGNVELEINEAYLTSYLSKGFDQVDTNGKVLKKGTPNDMNSLRLAYADAHKQVSLLQKENADLLNKVKTLSLQIEELNKKLKDKSKSDK